MLASQTKLLRVCRQKCIPGLGAVVVVALVLLSGCRAMETRDIDGSRFPDDQGPYYATGKKAVIDRRGYVTAWHSGSLSGTCAEVDLNTGQRVGIADTIWLETDVLFASDDASLRESGRAVLDEALERVAQYQRVSSVSIEAHTDARASYQYNRALSERRAEAVRSYLAPQLHQQVPVSVSALSERFAGAHGNSREAMQRDRRVSVHIEAHGPRDDSTSIAMCAASGVDEPSNQDVVKQAQPDPELAAAFPDTPVLSVGDRVRLRVAEDPDLDGIYEVNGSGRIDVPFVGDITAGGLDVVDVESHLESKLVETGFLHRNFSKVDVAVLQYAQADVQVNGAVFSPGRKTINTLDVEVRQFKQTQMTGDSARDRMLSNALQVAGGIRPDADLAKIQVKRLGRTINVDMTGVLTGVPVKDLSLIEGDVVTVPSSGQFREEQVRVSQITPPGVRVFISNLSLPANSNSLSAIGQDATSLPYGTRFLQALISGNCVGGTQYTNSARRAVLVSVNPINGRTEVVERSIQQLISDPERDSFNPYLMPNDGIACYDSEVTNIRDVARSFTDVLTPLSLLRVLLR